MLWSSSGDKDEKVSDVMPQGRIVFSDDETKTEAAVCIGEQYECLPGVVSACLSPGGMSSSTTSLSSNSRHSFVTTDQRSSELDIEGPSPGSVAYHEDEESSGILHHYLFSPTKYFSLLVDDKSGIISPTAQSKGLAAQAFRQSPAVTVTKIHDNNDTTVKDDQVDDSEDGGWDVSPKKKFLHPTLKREKTTKKRKTANADQTLHDLEEGGGRAGATHAKDSACDCYHLQDCQPFNANAKTIAKKSAFKSSFFSCGHGIVSANQRLKHWVAYVACDTSTTPADANLIDEDHEVRIMTTMRKKDDDYMVHVSRSTSRFINSGFGESSSVCTTARWIIVSLVSYAVLFAWTVSLFAYALRWVFYELHIRSLVDMFEFNDDRQRNERTYYKRTCDEEDITAFSSDEFRFNRMNEEEIFDIETDGEDDVVELIMTHGMASIPALLTQRTSERLRKFVLEEHEKGIQQTQNIVDITLSSNQHRWSIILGVTDHPSIAEALTEVATHPILRQALEHILGPDPALIELTAITTEHGATDEPWHVDTPVDKSHAMYGRSILPCYQVMVHLQRTPGEREGIGATALCPGTHMCQSMVNEDESKEKMCPSAGIYADAERAGDGIILDSNVMRRASEHVAYGAPKQVAFILSFTGRPNFHDSDDGRFLPPLGMYARMRWDMWGHTLEDCVDLENKGKWNALHSLGLLPYGQHRGWTWLMVEAFKTAHGASMGNYEEVSLDRLQSLAHEATHVQKFSSMIYVFGLVLFLLSGTCCGGGGGRGARVTRYNNNSKQDHPAEVKSTELFFKAKVRSIMGMHLFVAAFLGSFLTSLFWTDCALKVRERSLFLPPKFVSSETTSTNRYQETVSRNTVVPSISARDVLVGDRNHARHLYANRHFLDYHQGNRNLRAMAREIGTFYLENGFHEKQKEQPSSELSTSIVNQAMITQLLFYERRFFMQNSVGEFRQMENIGAIAGYVRGLILRENYPVILELFDEIDLQLGKAKYSRGAGIPYRWSGGLMLSLRNEMMNRADFNGASFNSFVFSTPPQRYTEKTLQGKQWVNYTSRKREVFWHHRQPNEAAAAVRLIRKEDELLSTASAAFAARSYVSKVLSSAVKCRRISLM